MVFKKHDSEIVRLFQKEIEKEKIAGEISRANFLILIFSVASITFMSAPFALGDRFKVIFTADMPKFVPFGFFATVLTYFIMIRILLGKLSKKQRSIPVFPRYMNAFVETSIPTTILIILSIYRQPSIYLLLTPPPFVYFIFIALSALRLSRNLTIFTGFIAATEYFCLALYFTYQSEGYETIPYLTALTSHGAKTFFILMTGIVTAFVVSGIQDRLLNSFKLIEERNRVTSIFGQHVSPKVVDRLLNQDEFSSETKHVCMMFLDIRNFTSFCENRSPEEVVNYLNTLFDFMIDSINRHNGIINKFLGDGFMAVFGAPISTGEDVKNAVNASLEIVNTLEKMIQKGDIPATGIGIGLHCGDAVTGNVGSADRREYTIIGDVVNLASRIEQLNKSYGSRILVSEDVRQKISDFNCEEIGQVTVKGRQAPVRIFKLA